MFLWSDACQDFASWLRFWEMIRENLNFLLARVTLRHLWFHDGQAIFAMHCSFSLIFLNFSWLEVPVHLKVEPACYSQPPMGAQSIITVFSQCISMLTKLRCLLRLIWPFNLTAHSRLVFFSETNFNGYCGPPAELKFRSAKVIYGVCEIFSIDSCPELQKNFHVSRLRHQPAIWPLVATKV